jgi:hypothetical protein
MPADLILEKDLTADGEACSRDVHTWMVGKGRKDGGGGRIIMSACACVWQECGEEGGR